jgi:phosphoribosylaminoimidazole-succinocarboxamide synthase
VSLRPSYSGKVRDVYDVGDDLLLMVASDRISAFDHVFAEPVPDKGRVLTATTAFFAGQIAGVAPTHLVATDPRELPAVASEIPDVAGRAMLVRRAEMLPIECIVRGYLTGSAWKEYQACGTMHAMALPAGLEESSRLPEPVFTPSTKASEGHDVNISFEQAADIVGASRAAQVRDLALAVYRAAASIALERGIVVADTKLEIGVIDGELAVCDEIVTPDSSRFWPAEAWRPGSTPPSFDKQPLRDWLEATGWDKRSDPPALPAEVVAATRARYVSAYEKLSGSPFSSWWGVGGTHVEVGS